ncbi:hypothetical protein LLOABG_LLOABG_02105, partial [Dysosmobacter welbionis]
ARRHCIAMPPSLACKYCKNCAIPLKHLCPN